MKAFVEFFKREFILVIAGIAAFVSCFFVPVTNYINYIDTDTVGLLFCLMISVAGLRETGVLSVLSGKLLGSGRTDTRKTGMILIFITYFSAMLFTNDVALIAFVPLTAALLSEYSRTMMYVIILQTAAANIGSMLTPFGNPQNIYLYSYYEMSPDEFFKVTAPAFLIGGSSILILCMFIKKQPLDGKARGTAEGLAKKAISLCICCCLYCVCWRFSACWTLSYCLPRYARRR